MARTDPQINIRLPAELKARVEAAMEWSGRSLTAEIVQRLEASFSTIEGKMLATRLDELATLNEVVSNADSELAAVVALGAPKDKRLPFENRKKHAAALRDRVQKDIDVLRALTTNQVVTPAKR